jgi:predicted transcriptional regulator
MTEKQAVIEAIEKLPDEATLEEIQDEIAILASIRQAEADVASGRAVPHEEVKKRIAEWLTK